LATPPNCPEGCGRVDRPKCFFELGGGCPRHAVRNEWHRKIRQWRRDQVENLNGAGI
jgi:hypothetical protein